MLELDEGTGTVVVLFVEVFVDVLGGLSFTTVVLFGGLSGSGWFSTVQPTENSSVAPAAIPARILPFNMQFS